MAKPRPTITKRLREKARQDKRRDKEWRKAQREAEREEAKAELDELGPNVDPDIAHIQPGPQKPIWEYDEFGG